MVMKMEKKSPAISVIVPMYNVERYIIYSLESLMQQTFQDFEVILIDDASTDNTYRVCRQLLGQDERVTILRNTVNQGQCNARNRGMELARGEYLYFLDSDDEMLPHALGTLYEKAEAENADVVHSNFYAMVYTQGRMRLRKSLWRVSRGYDITEGPLQGTRAERFDYQGKRSLPMPWMNLYRREFILKEQIVFPDLTVSEDDMFSVTVILKAKRFIRINEIFYLYRKHFHEAERTGARFNRFVPLMEKALETIENIFSPYSEEELPFHMRQDFKAGWVRAHLRSWLLSYLDTNDKADMEAIKSYLSAAFDKYSLLVSVFIYMLDNDTGIRGKVEKEDKERIASNKEVFAEYAKGTTAMQGDYDWLGCQARLATLIKGGEPAYYRDAYRYWAYAAFRLGRHQEALEAYQQALQYSESYSRELLDIFDEYLFAVHFQEFATEDIAKVHRLYSQQLKPVEPFSHGHKARKKGGKIRIGYLSAHFCRHDLFAAYYGFLFCYDKEAFEVYCYSTGDVQDDYTRTIKGTVDKFVEVSDLSHREIAEAIYADGVDVLIDLMGHLPGNALPVLAYKPAPLQISGVGYPSPAGLGTVDYYLTDEIIDPKGENDSLYEEKPLYLPCCLSFCENEEIPLPCELPGKQRGYLTFGVFGSYSQLDGAMLSLWQELMEKMPGSRLLVWADEFECEAMQAEAVDRFTDYGFDTGRVRFAYGNLWDGYREVDMVLDTFPRPGGIKMLEALYMGVPVVTLYGERRDTRLGLSILCSMGLEELAAGNRADYLGRALALAGNPERLNSLHGSLRSLLKGTKALAPEHYVRSLEGVLQQWRKSSLRNFSLPS